MEGHSASNDGLFLLFKEVTMEAAKAVSIEPQHRVVLPEFAWQDIPEAGAYVERGTGDLFRIPKEALVPGSSPIVHKESMGASRFVQLSKNDLSSAINRSELVSEYRRIMPESSQAGIRDVDHPELKPTQCSNLLECDVVRFEARPSANSDLVCPVRGWNEVVHDCNGWSRI